MIAPVGTVTVRLVEVLAVTVAVLLLKNFTTLFAGVVLKLVPVIVTDVPMGPDAGENAVMVGEGVAPSESFWTNILPSRLNTQAVGSKSDGFAGVPLK